MFHTSPTINTDIGAWNVASVVTFMYDTLACALSNLKL
jgi:hypothetical protein